MRSLILFFTLVITSLSYSQELSNASQYLKENAPNVYGPIKKGAIKKWKQDHEMIVYTINGQTKAFSEFVVIRHNKENYDKEVMEMAYNKWSTKNPDSTISTDWEMVVYEYKRQLKAKAAY